MGTGGPNYLSQATPSPSVSKAGLNLRSPAPTLF
jgi:hypothetical protein